MKTDPEKQVPVLNHEADGIKELDNLLPRWWVWLFWGCNLFGLLYLIYFHLLGLGDTQATAYLKEARAGEELKSVALASFEKNLSSLQPSNDPSLLRQGAQVYTTYCAPCHRADGGGLVGPNLCDDYWIHGGTYQDTLRTIINGVPEKGMLMWRGVLKPSEVQAVASHIYKLRGSNPANPKPPENQAPQNNKPSEFE
ncbi:MAG: cbb3-type cytochrome c oxidase N-terminal domain-containing protein [Verrucomicrobiota bacterium]|nr:cbb3-type cytochrome c oxidase N-terminal domain-containing protein [Verrucomicrobiota bacterium]